MRMGAALAFHEVSASNNVICTEPDILYNPMKKSYPVTPSLYVVPIPTCSSYGRYIEPATVFVTSLAISLKIGCKEQLWYFTTKGLASSFSGIALPVLARSWPLI